MEPDQDHFIPNTNPTSDIDGNSVSDDKGNRVVMNIVIINNTNNISIINANNVPISVLPLLPFSKSNIFKLHVYSHAFRANHHQ